MNITDFNDLTLAVNRVRNLAVVGKLQWTDGLKEG
jgi:hypothetical protein